MMIYEESYTQFDSELLDLIKRAIPPSFTSALEASGAALVIPQDRVIESKLKYDVSEEGGKFSLKLSWDNGSGEEDEEDNEDD